MKELSVRGVRQPKGDDFRLQSPESLSLCLMRQENNEKKTYRGTRIQFPSRVAVVEGREWLTDISLLDR